MSDFTADAVLKGAASSSFTADAAVYAHHIRADAWIMVDRWKHHRIRDHFGVESDLYVALSSNVGPYVAYTPIHWVLDDMVSRIEALENNNRRRAEFTADAFIALSGTYGRGVVWADAAITKSGLSGSFTADAMVVGGGSLTADAWIQAAFTADAYIV